MDYLNFSKKLGFMQGRLSPIIDNKIQAFPTKDWQFEFAKASNLGLNVMEWTVDYDCELTNPIFHENGRAKINRLKEEHCIEIPSVTADAIMQMPFWKFEGEERRKRFDYVKKFITACGYCDFKIIVIPIVDNSSIEAEEQKQVLINYFKSITQYLDNLNLKIAFEVDMPPETTRSFIEEFTPSIFGINYDIGNSASAGFIPKEEIACYGNRIFNVHIKDRKLGGTTVPLGMGDANFKETFINLKKANYEGNFIIQAARSIKNKHSEIMFEYIEFLKRVIEK